MKTFGTVGGIAGFVCAATYIFGFILLLTLLAPSGYGSDTADAGNVLAFINENTGLMITWNLSIYVVNGIALGVLAITLADRFPEKFQGFVRGFGLMWATLVVAAGMVANVGISTALAKYESAPDAAVQLWETLSAVENGLGGGNEIVGAVWAIVIAIAGLASGGLPRVFSLFSVVIGVSGLLTVVPQLGEAPGAIFGLGYILWFIWIGVILYRTPKDAGLVPAAD
ncbi:MAG: hypothetical protein ACSHXD_05680 [Marinosulfonomonas sp.]